MDNTESDQEASTQSSPEDISRQIDLRALGSPTFEPLSLIQIDRTPPEEGTEEEERESSESETETPMYMSINPLVETKLSKQKKLSKHSLHNVEYM